MNCDFPGCKLQAVQRPVSNGGAYRGPAHCHKHRTAILEGPATLVILRWMPSVMAHFEPVLLLPERPTPAGTITGWRPGEGYRVFTEAEYARGYPREEGGLVYAALCATYRAHTPTRFVRRVIWTPAAKRRAWWEV